MTCAPARKPFDRRACGACRASGGAGQGGRPLDQPAGDARPRDQAQHPGRHGHALGPEAGTRSVCGVRPARPGHGRHAARLRRPRASGLCGPRLPLSRLSPRGVVQPRGMHVCLCGCLEGGVNCANARGDARLLRWWIEYDLAARWIAHRSLPQPHDRT